MMAACPMLQSMDHAASGSRLEIRLSPDIKQQSIQSFLQYLYEGFMMVTEENYKDIEKIGRLLQVDSVIKCCADFCKSLTNRKGPLSNQDQYRYTFCDMIEFRHVRSSDLQKTTSDTQVKRSYDIPGHEQGSSVKRPRKRHSSDHLISSFNRGMTNHPNIANQPNASVEGRVLLDSLELVQVDTDDPGGPGQSVGVGIISHCDSDNETSVVVPTDECCNTAQVCGSLALSVSGSSPKTISVSGSSPNTVQVSRSSPNTGSSIANLAPAEITGQIHSPNHSADSMTEVTSDLDDRVSESTRKQADSDGLITSGVSCVER